MEVVSPQLMQNMITQEYHRLMAYHHAKRNAPQGPSFHSRRNVKTKANGLGQILKRSFIKPQVPLERVFMHK